MRSLREVHGELYEAFLKSAAGLLGANVQQQIIQKQPANGTVRLCTSTQTIGEICIHTFGFISVIPIPVECLQVCF